MKHAIKSQFCQINVSRICFFVLLISSFGVAQTFPQDLKPNLVLSQNDTSNLAIFQGKGCGKFDQENLNVLEIKLIFGKIFIGSKKSMFFVVSQSSFTQATGSIAYDKCVNTKSRNDIQMIAKLSKHLILVCGIGDKDRSCLHYKWSGSYLHRVAYKDEKLIVGKQLNASLEKFSFPTKSKTTLVYKYSNGHMYSAMKYTDRSFSTIVRVAARDYAGLRSQQPQFVQLETLNKTTWLNKPHFVGMVDAGDKMLIFFTEEAMETVDATEKVVVSRVAQVCKNDTGGRGILDGKWTSFFKARLNCSVPGSRPFYFNELQHITESVLFDGKLTVFATFTTPENSIIGSAVCAFTLDSIEDALNGPFRRETPNGVGGLERVDSPATVSPTLCLSERKSDEMLSFIEEHPFMADGVQAITPTPLVISTKHRFSAVAVEMNQKLNIAMLYIGTSEGNLLKLTIQQTDNPKQSRKIVLSETWKLYRPNECNSKSNGIRKFNKTVQFVDKDGSATVRKIILLPQHTLVAFEHCVISVPKKACWHYKCERSCSQSGNPYCGWRGMKNSNGYCVPISSLTKGHLYEQDLFQEKVYNRSCENDEEIILERPCISILETVVPLVLGLTAIFTIILLLVLCCERRKKKYSAKTRLNNSKMRHDKKKCKGQRALLVRHSKEDPLHVTIEAASPIEPSIYDRPKIGSPQPLNNLNMNCNYGTEHTASLSRHVKLHKEQINSSCDDTEWSEESRDFNDGFAENVCESVKPLDGSNILCQKSAISDKSGLSKFKSQSFSSPSRIKLGASSSSNYGSILTHTKNSKHFEKSRIVTNPNYLPVTPCVGRNTSKTKHSAANPNNEDTNVTSPELTSFSSNWEHSKSKKAVSESSGNFDLNFPRPPSCVLQNLQNFAPSAPKSLALNYPRSFEQLSESCTTTSETRKMSIASSSKMSYCLSPDDVAPSYAGSTTSGFVSSTSPQDPTLSPSSRRGIIVAKGILSAQSTLASPRTRRIKKKKRRSGEKSGGSSDHIYDEPFCPSSALKTTNGGHQGSSNLSENSDGRKVIFPSPEFCRQSDDDYDDIQQAPTPAGHLSNEASMCKKSKKRMFKSGKSKNDKFLVEFSEEIFTTPAFDEEPEVPLVEGWQEINYNPRFSTLQNRSSSYRYDDNCLSKATDHLEKSGSPFCTMRPKNRMRNKLPKLRNTNKEWNSSNNPLPVPTPAVPDI